MGFLLIFLSVGSFLLYQGTSGVDIEEVFVKEGDSVTLHTGVKKNPKDSIMWYFNDIRIAHINGAPSKICTDDQCEERFRDRLKLDNQTGSLTITNITNTDSGLYKLLINSDRKKIFSVTVHGVSAAERDEMKRKSVKEGESVTLDPGVMKTPNDVMTWYFNDALIAEITGDQSKICTDVQCDERFRDRLKLDHQTGSLTITNTKTTDSGEYQLQINSRSSLRRRRRSVSISRVKSFSVTVIDSGLSPGFVAGISITALMLVFVAVAAVIYKLSKMSRHGGKQGVTEESPSSRSLMTGEKTEVIESEIATASATLFPN